MLQKHVKEKTPSKEDTSTLLTESDPKMPKIPAKGNIHQRREPK